MALVGVDGLFLSLHSPWAEYLSAAEEVAAQVGAPQQRTRELLQEQPRLQSLRPPDPSIKPRPYN